MNFYFRHFNNQQLSHEFGGHVPSATIMYSIIEDDCYDIMQFTYALLAPTDRYSKEQGRIECHNRFRKHGWHNTVIKDYDSEISVTELILNSLLEEISSCEIFNSYEEVDLNIKKLAQAIIVHSIVKNNIIGERYKAMTKLLKEI